MVQNNKQGVDNPAFQGIYKSLGKACPFVSGDTFRRFAEQRFNQVRSDQALDLKTTCTSISIAFDGWGSKNHKHIIGGIGYWIGPDWERRWMNVEYAEAVWGKSGEGMAEVLMASFGEGIDKVTLVDTEKGPMEQRVLQIGLDIAHKVIAVCGDNAPNNDTFCDHFHRILKQKYDDDPALGLGLPRCLFGGRRSRIRCLAHILALIAKSVFAHLKSGTREQAEDIVQSVLNGDRQFPASCASLNICMKVRAFVLWIMASEERRKQWKNICSVFLPLDVDTRWNSLYLMMIEARKAKKEIRRFGELHPECASLVPTAEEWIVCEQVERCMEPFYNHTLTVSNQVPNLNQYLGIMWGIEDLLDDVSSGGTNYGDIEPGLRAAFEAGKQALRKWKDEMEKNEIYFAAHMLDPRIKFRLILEQYGDGADAIIDDVKAWCKKHYPPTTRPIEPQVNQEKPDRVSIHEWALLQRVREADAVAAPQIEFGDSWDRYFTEERVRSYECDDPDWNLQWWKANEFNYPDPARAARDLLAIPSAEVDVERLFSEGRDTIGVRRMAMDADTMRIVRLMKSHWDLIDRNKMAIAKAQLAQHQATFGVSLNSLNS